MVAAAPARTKGQIMRERVLIVSAVLAMFGSVVSAYFAYEARPKGVDQFFTTPTTTDGFELDGPGVEKPREVRFMRH